MLRALVASAIAIASSARAEGDLCARGAVHHGATIDLDVKDADIHDVFRLLADVGHVNLVVSDEVAGKVTLRMRRVAWDLAACAVAAVQHLAIIVRGNVVLVTRAS